MTPVRIPPTLRAEAGGARQVEADGETVREVLERLAERYPALGGQIFEDGDIAPFVNVYLGGEDVRTLDGLDTPIQNGQTLILLPAMAGGSTPLAGGGSRRAEPGSAAAAARPRHGAFRVWASRPIPSGTAPRPSRQERGEC